MSDWENNTALEFDAWQRKGRADGMAAGHRHGTEAILAQWRLDSTSSVLDVGCGQGWLIRQLCAQGIRIGVGIDISTEMIKHAQQFSSSNSQYLVSSSTLLPFENEWFSHVISIESLYYHPFPIESLKEWHRVSQPGGQLGLMVDLYQENRGSHAWVDALDIPVHLLSIPQYIALLTQAGWHNVAAQQVPDPRPVKPEHEFEASDYYPSYAEYCAFREAGSLILTAQR